MKKLLLFFMLMFVSLSSINAVTMSFSQNQNLYDIENTLTGNKLLSAHASSIDESFSIDNVTYNYDYVLEISDTNQDFYLTLENYYIGSNYTIMFRGDLVRDGTLYIQDLTLNEQGQYILKFIPFNNEPVKVYIDLHSNGGAGTFDIYYTEEKPKGFNALMVGFVDAFSNVFELNVKLWYLLYYIMIFVIVVSFMGALFGIASFIHKKTNEIKRKGVHGKGGE